MIFGYMSYTSCYLNVHIGICGIGGSDSKFIEEAADNTGSESDCNLQMFHRIRLIVASLFSIV